jgi:hypothetical protein
MCPDVRAVGTALVLWRERIVILKQ